MSIRERLKSAYENVAFNADKTWVHNSLTFQRANQELFSKECQFQLIKTLELRPRTVKDCIPKSKLAQYSNYEYNEARELSYAPSSPNFNSFMYYSKESENLASKEPWLLPEVDDLFIWFTNHHYFASQIPSKDIETIKNSKETFRYEPVCYESPILNADTFDKRILKMQISSDRIRNIWRIGNTFSGGAHVIKNQNIQLYKTPANIFYLSYHDTENKKITNGKSPMRIKLKDFEHLKFLAKSFKEQNCWVLKCMAVESQQEIFCDLASSIDHTNTKSEMTPSRRLYSAVLQGLASNTKPIKNNQSAVLHTSSEANLIDKIPMKTSVNFDISSIPIVPETCIQESFKCNISRLSTLHPYIQDLNHKSDQNKISPTPNKQLGSSGTSNREYNKSRLFNVATTTNSTSSNTSPVHANSSNYMQPTVTFNSFQNSIPVASPHYMSTYNYQFNSHFSNNYQNSYIYSNTFTNMSQIVVSRGIHPLPNQTFLHNAPVIMMQHNRMSTLYPISHQYMQQSYFSPSISGPRPVQRWLHSDFSRSTPPSQAFPSSASPNFIPQPPAHWLGQSNHVVRTNAHCTETNLNRIRSRSRRLVHASLNIPQANVKYKAVNEGKVSFSNENVIKNIRQSSDSDAVPSAEAISLENELRRFSCAQKTQEYCYGDFEDVNTSVNVFFEGSSCEGHVPITSSMSEDLEIQALEQYCNSNDNVYQELERQAEEEYEEHSENWRSPPNNESYFGGLGLQWNYI